MSQTHLWVYKDPHEEDRWVVFNDVDQIALDGAQHDGSTVAIPVLGGRCDAYISQRFMRTVYDLNSVEMKILKATWFVESVPFSEIDGRLITDWSQSPSDKRKKFPLQLSSDRKVILSNDGKILLAGQGLLSSNRPLFSVSDPAFPLEVPNVLLDDPNLPCEHLIISVHGIGESLWSRKAFSMRPFEVSCATLRRNINDFSVQPGDGRVEVLHINWYHILSESTYSKRVQDITLPTVPVLRQLANEAVADVFFYLNKDHHDSILTFVAGRIISIVELFKSRNPAFSGKLSLVGHSLGSVICYDILMTKRLIQDIHFHNLFLLGSPLGIFLTARDEKDILPFSQCKRVYNVFQPNDPVVYRIEPFIIQALKGIEPAIIPYFQSGGLATTTQVKRTASSLLGLFSGGDTSVFEKLTHVVSGPPPPKADSPMGIALKQIETMNDGQRIDWTVQLGFMPGATEYADALTAHMSYFDNKDVAKFIYDRIRNHAAGSPIIPE